MSQSPVLRTLYKDYSQYKTLGPSRKRVYPLPSSPLKCPVPLKKVRVHPAVLTVVCKCRGCKHNIKAEYDFKPDLEITHTDPESAFYCEECKDWWCGRETHKASLCIHCGNLRCRLHSDKDYCLRCCVYKMTQINIHD